MIQRLILFYTRLVLLTTCCNQPSVPSAVLPSTTSKANIVTFFSSLFSLLRSPFLCETISSETHPFAKASDYIVPGKQKKASFENLPSLSFRLISFPLVTYIQHTRWWWNPSYFRPFAFLPRGQSEGRGTPLPVPHYPDCCLANRCSFRFSIYVIIIIIIALLARSLHTVLKAMLEPINHPAPSLSDT